MNSKVTIGGVIVALVFSGLALFSQPDEVVVEKVVERVTELGAAAGPEHTEHQVFKSNFRVGGDSNYATSSTASSYTLTRTELDCDDSYVSWNAGLNVTLTTMASTSAPFSNMGVGQYCEQIWYSATTTAATTITFAAGTGVDLQEDEGGTVILNGLETARVTWGKKSDTDIFFIVEPYQVGD